MAALEELHDRPRIEDFTSLQEYEAQTPGTFFNANARPVLHFHLSGATIILDAVVQQRHFAFGSETHASSGETGEEVNIHGVDVWVTDQRLILYFANGGCRIPYTAITITAIDGEAVLLELNLSDSNNTADDDFEFFQIRIAASNVEVNGTNGTTPNKEALTTALYEAIAACQDLNPDPPGPGDEGEDGEPVFDETAPGATGWITSENMDQFVDANGNFKVPEGVTFVGGEDDEAVNGTTENGVQQPLGEGAGRTRTATEAGVEREDEDESKWRATGES